MSTKQNIDVIARVKQRALVVHTQNNSLPMIEWLKWHMVFYLSVKRHRIHPIKAFMWYSKLKVLSL